MDDRDENQENKYELVPPDGGWGWLVLFGCTLVNFLLSGTIKSFGVIFVEFLEKFEFSEVGASIIPALCYFLYCSLGPLSNYLSSKYSYRTVTLIGGTLASAGLIACYFASSLLYLCISYGVLFGTGTGLAFPPGIFIVTSYFQKYRGLANGIAISGSSFGSMILPPLLRYLLENFGVNGSVLIMGAITMNVWIGALFYHPVSWHMKSVPISECSENFLQDTNKSPELKTSPSPKSEYKEIVPNSDIETNKRNSNMKLAMINDKVETVLFYSPSVKKMKLTRSMSPRLNDLDSPLRRNSSYASVSSSKSTKCNSVSFGDSTLSRLQPLEYASQVTLKSITESLTPRKSGEENKSSQLGQLFHTPIFIIILISNATTAIGYTNFIIFLPVYANSLEYDKTASSLLLSVVACFDLFGRIGGSCISDLLPFSKKYYFVVGLIVSGISLVLVPFAENYMALCMACAIFGLSSGTFSGVFVVTIIELLGEDKLASSYTASLFVNGILQLIGPPICGCIYQSLRSFGVIMSILGITVTIGGGIWILPILVTTEKCQHEGNVERSHKEPAA